MSLFSVTNGLWLKNLTMIVWDSLFKKAKSVFRRIVYEASSIVSVKARATVLGKCLTGVEAVSAFYESALWLAASKEKNDFHGASLVTHLVNLQRRMSHDVENSRWNLVWIASAKINGENMPVLSKEDFAFKVVYVFTTLEFERCER
ncbi:hypothetical protein V6N13_127725 [Hibiscus sabdariffa]|uniref:Uncharacterized protein n=1 Tax=Hibiscus sabdariffa TaxID=183260 RepID=A0ABR2CF59_9ROSI